MGALPPSCRPKVDALLATIHAPGLVGLVGGDANAEMFVNRKNEDKCALIVSMRIYNRQSHFKACCFKLPCLQAPAIGMRASACPGAAWPQEAGGLRGAKFDIADCYWNICLALDLAGAIQVAAGNRTYALPPPTNITPLGLCTPWLYTYRQTWTWQGLSWSNTLMMCCLWGLIVCKSPR